MANNLPKVIYPNIVDKKDLFKCIKLTNHLKYISTGFTYCALYRDTKDWISYVGCVDYKLKTSLEKLSGKDLVLYNHYNHYIHCRHHATPSPHLST